jgi:tetratricopeptide (TPR) repeat protein
MNRMAVIAVWLAVDLCAFGYAPAVTETSQFFESQATADRNQGKLAAAEALDRRAVSDAEADGRGLVDALLDLARTLCAEAQYTEARKNASEADAVAGGHGFGHAQAMSTLALIDREQMRYAEAERLYRESVAAFNETVGQDDLWTANARIDLGYVLSMEGQFKEARRLLQSALPILTAKQRYVETAAALMRLGLISLSEGKFREAARELNQALDIDTRELGPENIRTANDAVNLGYLELQRGRYPQAEALVSRGLTVVRKWPGSAEVLKGFSLADLAAIYVKEKRLEEAEPLYREAVAILEKSAEPANSSVANVLYGYSGLLRALQRYSDAEAVEVRATAIQVRSAIHRG